MLTEAFAEDLHTRGVGVTAVRIEPGEAPAPTEKKLNPFSHGDVRCQPMQDLALRQQDLVPR